MEKKRIKKLHKLVTVRNGKVLVFSHENRNIERICEELGVFNSFEHATAACVKYPLTVKPYILDKVSKKWN